MKVPEKLIKALERIRQREVDIKDAEGDLALQAELYELRMEEIENLLEATIDGIAEHRAKSRGRTFGVEYDTNLRELGSWAAAVIKKKINDPCIDNIRFALYGDMDDMEEYFIKRANGCCGFYDGIHRYPKDNKQYLVGCNYGH